jgi:hypothetical protein
VLVDQRLFILDQENIAYMEAPITVTIIRRTKKSIILKLLLVFFA